jgi:hypothetical protein
MMTPAALAGHYLSGARRSGDLDGQRRQEHA